MAEEWRISERRVRKLCQNKRIRGVKKVGGMYFIPCQSEKPVDLRNYRGLDVMRRNEEMFYKLDIYKEKVYSLNFIDCSDFLESDIESLFYLFLYWGVDDVTRKRYKKLFSNPSGFYLEKPNMTVAEVRDDVLKKYKEMNDYVNNLIVGKKISIIKLIEKMYCMFRDSDEEEDCYRIIVGNDGNRFSASKIIERLIRDHKRSKDHPVEKSVKFFLEFVSYLPLNRLSIPIGGFLLDLFLKQLGYPAIPNWERFEKLSMTYMKTENPKPVINYTVSLLRKRMREASIRK